MSTDSDDALLQISGPDEGVLEITLNRPQARNALSTPLVRELVERLAAAEHDSQVRCALITGGERIFAAGADLAEMARKDQQAVLLEERPALFAALGRWPKPLIAAVNGYALGGGCELAMHADIVIASPGAQFGQPEIRLGILPGASGTQRLTRAVGKALAMKMVLSGEAISAQEALAAGLVAEISAEPDCRPRARELARRIASMAPLATRLAKEAILASFETPLSAGIAQERRNFVILAGTRDRQEGIQAFLEKRPPVWEGR